MITINLDIENGGTPITDYYLEINAGGLNNDAYHELSTYISGQQSHTLDLTLDSLTYGSIYKLRYRVRNSEGFGEYSDATLVALNSLPGSPPAPLRVESGSSETSIAISWEDMSPDPELDGNQIVGYRVYAAKEQSNIYNLVYDGTGYPQIRSTIITGLTPGDLWDFKVSAVNFNGEGSQSTTSL